MIHENECRPTDATANKHAGIADRRPLISEQMVSECAVVTGVGVMVCRAAAISEWACVPRPASLIKFMQTTLISL